MVARVVVELGADEVIDYRTQKFEDTVRGVDLISRGYEDFLGKLSALGASYDVLS